MGEEFVRLNSMLVQFRPDDILRGLEQSVPALATIRRACPYVGYDMIRRGTDAPVLSMSTVLRCWRGSIGEVPGSTGHGSAQHIATTMTEEEAALLVTFLHHAFRAWGRDPEYYRLWSTLNLTMAMWLYRRLVIDRDPTGQKRHIHIGAALFEKCLMALSADPHYLAWLTGRRLSENDRSPAYTRLRAIFVRRLGEEMHASKIKMPSPSWFQRTTRN